MVAEDLAGWLSLDATSSKDIRLGEGGLGLAAFFALETPFDDFFELPCSLTSDSSVPLLRLPRIGV